MDVGSCLLSCLHPFYLVFEFWDVLGRFVTGWLSLETKTSCPDFDLSARAGVLALEREFDPSSISCAVFEARAWDWPLEQGCVSAARAGS